MIKYEKMLFLLPHLLLVYIFMIFADDTCTYGGDGKQCIVSSSSVSFNIIKPYQGQLLVDCQRYPVQYAVSDPSVNVLIKVDDKEVLWTRSHHERLLLGPIESGDHLLELIPYNQHGDEIKGAAVEMFFFVNECELVANRVGKALREELNIINSYPNHKWMKEYENQTLPIGFVIPTRTANAHELAMLLQSLVLFADNVFEIVVIVNPEDTGIASMLPPSLPIRVVAVRNWFEGRGAHYAFQQWVHMHADTFTSAPIVAIMNSDAVLVSKLSLRKIMHDNRTVVRFLRCKDGINGPGKEPGCDYYHRTRDLLGVPSVGNFMRSMPQVWPRWIFKAVRQKIEEVHQGRPFDNTLAYLTPVEDGSLWYGEFTTFGNFVYHFSNESLMFVEEGVDPMFPHVGRHLGHEKLISRASEHYIPLALAAIRDGACGCFPVPKDVNSCNGNEASVQQCHQRYGKPNQANMIFEGEHFGLSENFPYLDWFDPEDSLPSHMKHLNFACAYSAD